MPRPRGLSVAGDRIRHRRLELEKTQREMAAMAGIGVSTWANYENGHQDRASTRTLRKVARALRLDLDELVAPRSQPSPPGPDRPPNKPPEPTGPSGPPNKPGIAVAPALP